MNIEHEMKVAVSFDKEEAEVRKKEQKRLAERCTPFLDENDDSYDENSPFKGVSDDDIPF